MDDNVNLDLQYLQNSEQEYLVGKFSFRNKIPLIL